MPVRAAFGILIPTTRQAAPPVTLPIGYVGQGDYDQLCWAACCAMVLRANGDDEGLLDVAHAVTRQPCSADPNNSPCNEPIDPASAWDDLHVAFRVPTPQQGPISSNALADQIANGRQPVQVFWSYNGGNGIGHVILITGWDQASGTFGVYDPLLPPHWVEWSYLKGAGGKGWWSKTYFAIGNRLA